MIRTRIIIFLLFTFFIYGQDNDNRLALVIGNANYVKGELKNPVNDARLIASTLDSLDFDVILKENLTTKREMLSAIKEFGSKRSEYDVAFVYYAGHGIQVDDENFLLPTKEVFEEEFDVMDYGVSVQNIMRYLTAQTNEVNILILDACRDNPFESNWNTTRSLKGGGLAKIPPPTGSLIAFSTNSGQTAPDGSGDNSTYTVSLAKNMLLKDTSIDQVFRNVRAEVLAQTNGAQRPVEATQLTGETFYLNQTELVEYYNRIDNLIKNKKYNDAFNEASFLVSKFPLNSMGHKYRAMCLYLLGEFERSKDEYTKLIIKYPEDSNLLVKRSHCFKKMGAFKNAISDISLAINQNPKNGINFIIRGDFNYDFENFQEAIEDYNTAIEINPDESSLFYKRGLVYFSINEFNLALSDFLKSETLNTEMENIIESGFYNKIAVCYQKIDNTDKALEYYTKNINISNSSESYLERAIFFESKLDYINAESDYFSAIKIDRENPFLYFKRANLYQYELINEVDDQINTYILSIKDYSKAIELSPNNSELFYHRGSAYNALENHEMALADYIRALELDKNNDLVNNFGLSNLIGVLYLKLSNYEAAIEYFKNGIKIDYEDLPTHFNLANAFIELRKFDEAEDVYLNLLNRNNNNNSDIFQMLGYYYLYQTLEYDKAIKYFENSNDLIHNDAFSKSINFYEISKAKTKLGDFRGAIINLNKSIKSDPEINNYFNVFSQIGKNFNLLGEIEEAERFYTLDVEKSKSLYSDDSSFFVNSLILRAEFYSSISKTNKADVDFDLAFKLVDDKTHIFAYFIRHKILSLEYDEALKVSDQAIFLDNTNPIYNYYKSYIYTNLNKPFYALKNLDECIFKIKNNFRLLPELIDIDGKTMEISKPFVKRIKIYSDFNQKELICDSLDDYYSLTGNTLNLYGLKKVFNKSECQYIKSL